MRLGIYGKMNKKTLQTISSLGSQLSLWFLPDALVRLHSGIFAFHIVFRAP